MNNSKQLLNPIIEENNELCVELTYYSDILPAIKSYYIMNLSEYEELNSLYMDIYIENFINGETLTKNNFDIYLINNPSNIIICKNFIEQFGNPFDIKSLIYAKKLKNTEVKTLNVTYNELLINNFSDSEMTIDDTSSDTESDSVEYSERMIKSKNIINLSDDKSINTLTEIIDTFNKTKIVNKSKIQQLIENKSELLKDEVLKDIIAENF